jgi:hypothetical protein
MSQKLDRDIDAYWEGCEPTSETAGEAVDRLVRIGLEIKAENERFRAALTLIASFGGKTLIAPSFGPEYDKGHQAGAHAAFESAADIARTTLPSDQGAK